MTCPVGLGLREVLLLGLLLALIVILSSRLFLQDILGVLEDCPPEQALAVCTRFSRIGV
jgi:hypothetical protein